MKHTNCRLFSAIVFVCSQVTYIEQPLNFYFYQNWANLMQSGREQIEDYNSIDFSNLKSGRVYDRRGVGLEEVLISEVGSNQYEVQLISDQEFENMKGYEVVGFSQAGFLQCFFSILSFLLVLIVTSAVLSSKRRDILETQPC